MSSSTDKQSAPRVSVIIPTYNWAPVLPYSIGSVLDQTFTDFELFVIGDGCTDESAEVVASFQDPRVHWINLPRNTRHQSGPNNEGQQRARGEVVAYLGHDDLWLPHHLELLVPVIEDGEEAAHTSILMVDPGKAPRAFPGNGWTYAPGAWIPPTSTALARRALVKAGGWRAPSKTLSIEPEADLLVRVSDFGGPPVWIPRLTCVKFSASKRRDVYRTRPHFEQAKWLGTIRQAQNPEEAILATIGTQDVRADEPPPRARLTTRAWRSFRFRLMKRLRLNSAKARNRRTRRFKGL